MRLDDRAELDRRHGAGRPAGFRVEARREPGILIRILAQFARRGIEIDRLACTTEPAVLRLEVLVGDLPDQARRQVAGGIRQVVGVVRLEVETEFAAMPASNAPAAMRLCA